MVRNCYDFWLRFLAYNLCLGILVQVFVLICGLIFGFIFGLIFNFIFGLIFDLFLAETFCMDFVLKLLAQVTEIFWFRVLAQIFGEYFWRRLLAFIFGLNFDREFLSAFFFVHEKFIYFMLKKSWQKQKKRLQDSTQKKEPKVLPQNYFNFLIRKERFSNLKPKQMTIER